MILLPIVKLLCYLYQVLLHRIFNADIQLRGNQ